MAALLSAGGDGSNPSSSISNNQRYAMFSPGESNAGGLPDIYIIDTVTGRVWRRLIFTDIKDAYLSPLPYLTADHSSVSVTPPFTTVTESSSLQKLYEQELQHAAQKESDNK